MQSAFLQRRAFFRLCAACSAFLTRPLSRPAKAAPQTNRSAVGNWQNYVAIQIKPYAWVDGIAARFGVIVKPLVDARSDSEPV
jgi:hypothetical protein